jgi:UDP:flavonoid glycosyltransferase YjiC (YdhE family)
MGRPRRVLFFAEAVTLAHVARPVVLAKSLESQGYEVTIACSPRYRRFVEGGSWNTLPLNSISSQRFMDALARGGAVYDVATLREYVREDLAIIESIQPDLVVGDFRLSLSVSCRCARVPYATVTNAYWSPFLCGHPYPLPVLPMTRVLPIGIAEGLFRIAQPFALPFHCKPLNRVRAENGLPSLGNDLRRVYTDADHTLYADAPGMFETERLPSHHRYLGPILWSPPLPKPVWWDTLPPGKPIVYLTLGSSGRASVLGRVLDALADMPVTVIASTAGSVVPDGLASNIHIAEYLPGIEAAARSAVVICNGGSPTSHQALAAGVPVLGIASNMDQFLNMAAIVKAGAGLLLRADRLGKRKLRTALEEVIEVSNFRTSAVKLAGGIAPDGAALQFRAWVDDSLSASALGSGAG